MQQAMHALGSDVHVWRITLDAAASQAGIDTLSEDEVARAGRFVFEHDKRRFVAAHTALRTVLSLYTGQGPKELDLGETANGKPVLHGSSLAFNLSHSGALALLAVADDSEIGIDIQHVTSGLDETSIARTLFSPGEIDHLATLAADERRMMFFRLWTCREAMLKAAGVGLYGTGLEIALDERGGVFVRSPPTGCSAAAVLHELQMESGYVAAVAWSPRTQQATICHFDFNDLAASDRKSSQHMK